MMRATGRGERVAIFVDGWNFAKATWNGMGMRVDFRKLLTVLSRDEYLIRAFYYLGEWTEEAERLHDELRRLRAGGDDEADIYEAATPDRLNEQRTRRQSQQSFIRFLNRNGYRVVSKPIKVFADGSTKADLDIDLAIDMLTLAEHCERMVLVSGDSDFVPVVRAVGMRGVRVTVVGTQLPQAYDATPDRPRAFPARASDELLDAADEFIDLTWIRQDIELFESRRTREA